MNILIVKTSSLGDIIHAFPVLQYLRKQYPGASIDWVVESPFAELIQAHPAINEVLCIHTKKWRKGLRQKAVRQEIKCFFRQLRSKQYDLLFDLQGNIKSSFVTGAAKSSLKVGFGRASVPEWPNLLVTNRRYNPPLKQNIREDYLFLAQSTCENFQSQHEGVQLRINAEEEQRVTTLLAHPFCLKRKNILVCPGSNWANKQLSKNTLVSFLRLLVNDLDGCLLFGWGSQAEKQNADELAQFFPNQSLVIDRLPLPTLQNLMAQLNLVVAMDSLPLHLAGTTSTPTYSVFGASSSHKYQPIGAGHHAFQGQCPYEKTFEKRCPILRACSTGKCIKDIQGEALFEHFKQWWHSHKDISLKTL